MSTYQSAIYVILTALRPDSGLVVGDVRAVAHAEVIRRLSGAEARDALVAVYVRLADALVSVRVESAELLVSESFVRYRVSTWLRQQLIGQCELDVPSGRD